LNLHLQDAKRKWGWSWNGGYLLLHLMHLNCYNLHGNSLAFARNEISENILIAADGKSYANMRPKAGGENAVGKYENAPPLGFVCLNLNGVFGVPQEGKMA